MKESFINRIDLPYSFKELVLKKVKIEKKIQEEIKKTIKKGDVVYWEVGKYEGRKAIVTDFLLDYGWYRENDVAIQVRVKTYRKDGKGFLDNSDHIHRTYYLFGSQVTQRKGE